MKKAILAAFVLFAFQPGFAQTAPETVKVQAGAMPDAVVTGFVKTFTAPSQLSGKIARWYTGICLKTQGLPPELAEAVSKRILAVAAEVGAKTQVQPCDLNAVVVFDPDPQSVMDDIAAHHEDLLGTHDPSQTRELAKVRYPIQAWYATETQDDKGVSTVDTKNQSALCDGLDMTTQVGAAGDLKNGGMRTDPARLAQVTTDAQRYCGHRYDTGSRVRDGIHSHIVAVTVVAAMDTVNYHELGAVADYLALMILSQTKAFDTCEKMETIANLLVPACDLNNRVDGLMPGDVAYLKALYRADIGGTLVAQQAAIVGEMKKVLAER